MSQKVAVRLSITRMCSFVVACLVVAGSVAPPKDLILIRHGVTNMNVYLSSHPYGEPGFVDPGDIDTRLTSTGRTQAASLEPTLARAHASRPIDVLVSSPLSRAMETATLALGAAGNKIPQEVSPLIAERRWLSSDVGRCPSELCADFPGFAPSLADLPARWWWEGDASQIAEAKQARLQLQRAFWQVGAQELKGVALPVEPADEFVERIENFRQSLLQRPERRIAVVAHWGVFYSLLGRSLRNCEMVECTSDELLETLRLPPD